MILARPAHCSRTAISIFGDGPRLQCAERPSRVVLAHRLLRGAGAPAAHGRRPASALEQPAQQDDLARVSSTCPLSTHHCAAAAPRATASKPRPRACRGAAPSPRPPTGRGRVDQRVTAPRARLRLATVAGAWSWTLERGPWRLSWNLVRGRCVSDLAPARFGGGGECRSIAFLRPTRSRSSQLSCLMTQLGSCHDSKTDLAVKTCLATEGIDPLFESLDLGALQRRRGRWTRRRAL